jgi:hypothetical protein
VIPKEPMVLDLLLHNFFMIGICDDYWERTIPWYNTNSHSLFIGHRNDMKESLFISSLIGYINSGPTLPLKSLLKRGPCCVFLLMASSRHIILGLYH